MALSQSVALHQNVAVSQSGVLCQKASDGKGVLEGQEVVFCPSPVTKIEWMIPSRATQLNRTVCNRKPGGIFYCTLTERLPQVKI